MQLAGKVALVSGASRGIGRGIVAELARAGCNIAVNDVAHLDEAESAAEMARRCGVRAAVFPADVADLEAVERMVEAIAGEFGHLDIAVSNAAFSDRQPFYEAEMSGFRRTIDVTMWGAFHLLRGAVKQMLAQGSGGSVVVVSSPH